MDCLKDYIGLAGCGASVPASGLFINSLPGISLKAIDSLADADQVNYVGVWNDVQIRAIKRLELMVISEMAKNTALKGSKFQTSTHVAYSTTDFTDTVDAVVIKFGSYCSSPFLFHYFNDIKFETSFLGDVTITVKDDETGEMLWTDTCSPTGSPAICPVNKKFYRRYIRVEIVNSGNLYKSMPMQNIYHGCGSIQYGYMSNNVYKGYTDCLGVNLLGYSIGCDALNLACDNKSLFASTLWYLEGSELMMERMASNRVNFWTMDRKQAEELKAYYDTEAEKNLKMAMNGISIADCDCCTKCDPVVAIREARL